MSSSFYVKQDGVESGPFTAKQLRDKANAGEIRADALVRPDQGEWVVAAKFGALAYYQLAAAKPTTKPQFQVKGVGGLLTKDHLLAMAASGELRPDSLVRQVPDGDWMPASSVPGLTFPPGTPKGPKTGSRAMMPAPLDYEKQPKRTDTDAPYGMLRMLSTGITILAFGQLMIGLLTAAGLVAQSFAASGRYDMPVGAPPTPPYFLRAIATAFSSVGLFIVLAAAAEFIILAIDVAEYMRKAHNLLRELLDRQPPRR